MQGNRGRLKGGSPHNNRKLVAQALSTLCTTQMDPVIAKLQSVSAEASGRLSALKAELIADFETQIGRAEFEAENWTPNYDLKHTEFLRRKEGSLRDRWETALREEKKSKTSVAEPQLTRQYSQPPPHSPITADYPSHAKAVAVSGSTRDLEQKIKRLDEENKRLREHLDHPGSATPQAVAATPPYSSRVTPLNKHKSDPHYLDKEYMQAVAAGGALVTAYDLQGQPHIGQVVSQSTPRSIPCTPIPDDLPRHTPARPVFSLAAISDPLQDDQYELTAWEDSDAEGKSRAEREEEKKQRRAKKHVPKWCNDWVSVARSQWRIDPDSVFYSLRHFPKCDLALVFSGDGGKKKRRGSSGNWGVDGLTDVEIQAYRVKMGQLEKV